MREQGYIEEIVAKSLLMQANAAAKQRRPLDRGTHAKGVCAREQFEVFDVTAGRDSVLAARLAKGMFAKSGVYPAIVRFGISATAGCWAYSARTAPLACQPHSSTATRSSVVCMAR